MSAHLDLFTPDAVQSLDIPLVEEPVSAGFPSPSEHYGTTKLDLNKELIKDPSATFFARVRGVSMVDEGVDDGDLLIIDRSMERHDNCMAVCFIDGEFTLKRFQDHGDYGLLVPANADYEPIQVSADNDFLIWGVVRYIIKRV